MNSWVRNSSLMSYKIFLQFTWEFKFYLSLFFIGRPDEFLTHNWGPAPNQPPPIISWHRCHTREAATKSTGDAAERTQSAELNQREVWLAVATGGSTSHKNEQ